MPGRSPNPNQKENCTYEHPQRKEKKYGEQEADWTHEYQVPTPQLYEEGVVS